MGDVLMTTPALSALKHHKNAKLTLLTSTQGQAISNHIPDIDEVMIYEAPWLKASSKRNDAESEKKIVNEIAIRKFDMAIIFTVFSQNPLPAAFLCYLAEIPIRIAYCRENPYQLLSHWFPESEPEKLLRHESQRHLDLISALGIDAAPSRLKLKVNHELVVEVMKSYIPRKFSEKVVVIHTGSTAPSRRFSPERFKELAIKLSNQLDVLPVFTGTESEKPLIDEMIKGLDCKFSNLAGYLKLDELISLISISKLLISNNSGPVHMAAALGVPVIDLYALTNPQHTPWMIPHHTLFQKTECAWCYKSICPEGTNACLDISVNEILEKSKDLLIRFQAPCFDLNATKPLFLKKDQTYAQT
jgi:lipopolysaccharide heptosyltransferase II